MFETGSISSTLLGAGRSRGTGASSAVHSASSRAQAASYAASAPMPDAGRTGVTTVTLSSMVSNTAMTVGRMKMPSGRPRISGLSSGIRSINRTMS